MTATADALLPALRARVRSTAHPGSTLFPPRLGPRRPPRRHRRPHADTVAKAHAPDTDPAAPGRPPRPSPRRRALRHPPRPAHRPGADRPRRPRRPVTFWPYGTPVDPEDPDAAPWEDGRRPARPPPPTVSPLPRLAPPMRGPAKAARAVARMVAAAPRRRRGHCPGTGAWHALPAWARGEAAPPAARPASSATATCTSASSSAIPPRTGPWLLIDVDDLGWATPPGTSPAPPPGTPAGLLAPDDWPRFLAAYRSAGRPGRARRRRPLAATGRPRPRADRADRGPRPRQVRRGGPAAWTRWSSLMIDACARMRYIPPELAAGSAS